MYVHVCISASKRVCVPSKTSHSSCSQTARRGSAVSKMGRAFMLLSHPEARRQATRARRSSTSVAGARRGVEREGWEGGWTRLKKKVGSGLRNQQEKKQNVRLADTLCLSVSLNVSLDVSPSSISCSHPSTVQHPPPYLQTVLPPATPQTRNARSTSTSLRTDCLLGPSPHSSTWSGAAGSTPDGESRR